MAAAKMRGIQSQNIIATPKHFACNNKETNRKYSDSIVSEHALELKAGNDIKMPAGEPDKLMKALEDGLFTREELAISVKRLLEMILWIE